MAKYKKLIGPMRMEISEDDVNYGVSFLPGNPEYKLSGFLVESEISFLVNIIRRVTKENIKPVRITTTMNLKDSSLEDFTGVKVKRGEKNQIVFDKSDMDVPFISFDESMRNSTLSLEHLQFGRERVYRLLEMINSIR